MKVYENYANIDEYEKEFYLKVKVLSDEKDNGFIFSKFHKTFLILFKEGVDVYNFGIENENLLKEINLIEDKTCVIHCFIKDRMRHRPYIKNIIYNVTDKRWYLQ